MQYLTGHVQCVILIKRLQENNYLRNSFSQYKLLVSVLHDNLR